MRWAHKDPNNRDQDPEPDEVASAVASAVREGRIEEDELFDGPRAKRIRRAVAPQFLPGPYAVESQGYAPRGSRHLTYEPPEGEEGKEGRPDAPARVAHLPQYGTAAGEVQVGVPVDPAPRAVGAGQESSFAQQFAAAVAMDATAAIPPPSVVPQAKADGGGDTGGSAAEAEAGGGDRASSKGGMDLLAGYGSGSDSDA